MKNRSTSPKVLLFRRFLPTWRRMHARAAIRFGDLSSVEQRRVSVNLDPPAPIIDSIFFHNGVQFAATENDFSPTQRVFEIDDLQSSSSSSASSSILNRPPSHFTGTQSSSSGIRYRLLQGPLQSPSMCRPRLLLSPLPILTRCRASGHQLSSRRASPNLWCHCA